MRSLREQEQKTNTIIDRLILQWKTPQNNHKVLLLVEGPQDIEFYSRYFDGQTVGVRSSGGCSSMKKVYEGIKSNSSIFQFYLAICDSDFARINQIEPYGENVFYADTHDHEMMCIACEHTFRSMFLELTQCWKDSLFEQIARELHSLTLFKWYNYTFHCNCSFGHMELVNISLDKLLDYNYLFGDVCAHSPNVKEFCTLESLKQFVSEKETLIDWKEITNGHDFIKRFVGYCKRNSIGQFPEKKLRKLLHENFRKEEFSKTQLYNDVCHWEERNSKHILS